MHHIIMKDTFWEIWITNIDHNVNLINEVHFSRNIWRNEEGKVKSSLYQCESESVIITQYITRGFLLEMWSM